MTYLVLASILLAVLYVGAAIWVRWRAADASCGFSERLNAALPDSISALVYKLPRGWQWLWIVWMWVVSLLMCIPLIEVLPDEARALGFATLVCLMLCGAMPISDSSVNRRAHNVFGILGGILSQVCVAIISPWWLAVWSLMAVAWIWTTKDCGRTAFDGKGVFLAEMICAATVFGAVLSILSEQL